MVTGTYALISLIVLLLATFPGGTILMAWGCRHETLTGRDWILSVILPCYGLAKVLFGRRSSHA